MKRRCPNCHRRDLVPIVYGLPSVELAQRAARGEVVLGGCAISPGQPTHRCAACGHERRGVLSALGRP